MACNVGGKERSIRIGAGLLAVMIGLFAGLSTAVAGTALAVGITLLLTGAAGYCPLFTLFGINTHCSASDMKK